MTTTSPWITIGCTQIQVRVLANDLFREHGLLPGPDGHMWSLAFDNARMRGGACHHGEHEISLSRHMVAHNGLDKVRTILLHEIAHAMVGDSHAHDRVWRTTCLAIGGDGEVATDWDDGPARWKGTCEGCGCTWTRHRLTARTRSGRHTRCGAAGTITWKDNNR